MAPEESGLVGWVWGVGQGERRRRRERLGRTRRARRPLIPAEPMKPAELGNQLDTGREGLVIAAGELEVGVAERPVEPGWT